jgi:hypothetical protein
MGVLEFHLVLSYLPLEPRISNPGETASLAPDRFHANFRTANEISMPRPQDAPAAAMGTLRIAQHGHLA